MIHEKSVNQNSKWNELIKVIKKEVVPALGCTEPISLALTAATAAKTLGLPIEKIEAKVSANLMKNGMGVTVPGTETTGLLIAAAVGALGGDPEGQLEVLKTLTEKQIAAAKCMVKEHRVELSIAAVSNILFAQAQVFHGNQWARVTIADTHTNIIKIEKNDLTLFEASTDQDNTAEPIVYSLADLQMEDIFEFATEVPIEQIDFIHDAANLNISLSAEGMRGTYGLHIGATMNRQIETGLLPDGLLTQILMRTTAASDARMGGANLPAMTNSGSGNQGITATMPVVVVAEYLKVDRETLIRALILSHMTAIYIHDKLPKLSALCAVTTAAMGAAAGMAWLLKRDIGCINMAISNMIGDVAGMICDGASNSCAMKVSTSATSAYKAVLMALDETRVTGNEGIVDENVDQSIKNLGQLACQGMTQTDAEILQIMLNKAIYKNID